MERAVDTNQEGGLRKAHLTHGEGTLVTCNPKDPVALLQDGVLGGIRFYGSSVGKA